MSDRAAKKSRRILRVSAHCASSMRPRSAASLFFAIIVLLTSSEAATWTLKQIAIATLKASGLNWNAEERSIEVTEAGQAKLKTLTEILPAVKELQVRELNLAGCKVLENVDGLRGLPDLQVINLSECPALKNVDGIAASKQMKKIYLFQSTNVAEESVDALVKRFPKCYLVLPDGTGLNPPREK
jgi:hypothetical protein